MAKFKIFYSWQSDLSGSKTRYFIRDCIDDAIAFASESEKIEADRDEATKGLTGSPDIVTSIFTKIDECDLFVADVTLCFTGDVDKEGIEKHSPNPNVMLELGYAVKTLSWERVICLSNTDFGSDYPFDIDHNRRVQYSLDGNDKKAVQRKIAKIILSNIQSLQGQIPRTKSGFSSHIIGSYDFILKKVNPVIVPHEFINSKNFRLHNDKLILDANKLVAEIQLLSERIDSSKAENEKLKKSISDSNIRAIQQSLQITPYKTAINSLTGSYKESEIPAVWNNIEKDKELIKRCLDIDVGDTFFDLGDLKLVKHIAILHGESYKGSNDEKSKFNKLIELIHILSAYVERNNYLNTFNGMRFIPLAIQNNSPTADTNIRIVVNVDNGEAVDPSEHLIVNDLEGDQGQFCSDEEPGIIPELFSLEEDGIIHLEEKGFDPTFYSPRIPIYTKNGFVDPPKTAEDYKTELECFIASTNGKGYYEFFVRCLRPGECRWFSEGMLLKPEAGNLALSYRIHSDHSTGESNGKLELKSSSKS